MTTQKLADQMARWHKASTTNSVTRWATVVSTTQVTTESAHNVLTSVVGAAPTVATSPWSGFGNAFTFAGFNNGYYTSGLTAGNSATGVAGVSGVGSAAAFTIEARIKPLTTAVPQMIAGRWSGGGAGTKQPMLYMNGGVLVTSFRDNTGTEKDLTSATTLTASNTYTVACTYDGTTLRQFINGTLDATTLAVTGVEAPDTTTRFMIGRNDEGGQANDGGYPFSGPIDEVRWSNTCRYTATYTPATAPFTVDSSTLGLWHLDSLSPADTVTLKFAGSSTLVTGVPYLAAYAPSVGDVVSVLQTGSDLLVLGSASKSFDTLVAGQSIAPVYWQATASASQALGAATTISLASPGVDTASAGYTNGFRAPTAGIYKIVANAMVDGCTAGDSVVLYLMKNGVWLRSSNTLIEGGGFISCTPVVALESLAAGDTVQFAIQNATRTAGSVNPDGRNSYFWVAKV